MLIDFGNGDAIMARHEEYTLRGLEARELRQTASQSRPQGGRAYNYAVRIRCEMDYWRLVLADRLDRFDLARSILHADNRRFFSARECR